MLPDGFQRWPVTIAHSLLISKIKKKKKKSENYLRLTEKISVFPKHMWRLSQLIYFNTKIFLISNRLRINILVSLIMHIPKWGHSHQM